MTTPHLDDNDNYSFIFFKINFLFWDYWYILDLQSNAVFPHF